MTLPTDTLTAIPCRRDRAANAIRCRPERVRSAQFSRTPLGRRGLNEDEVRLFLARVAEDLAAVDAEKAEMRAEINRLRNYFRDRDFDADARPGQPSAGSPAPVASPGLPARPDVAAINLMSRAQQAADAQVAQAEEYSRRLVHQARAYYDRIVQEATLQANEAAQRLQAAQRAGDDASASVEREALEQRIAWLRTFAEVTQVQLRSVFEALTQEVDKLSDLPDPAGARFPIREHIGY